jgi:hypothetical protein
MNEEEVPSSVCLFDRPVPVRFAVILFDQKDALPRGARVEHESGWIVCAGVLRSQAEGVEERDNYAFLHGKELASRSVSTVYSLADVADDLVGRGIAVLMNQGGYFAAAIIRESPMRAVVHKGHRRYVVRKGQGHRQSKHTSAHGGKKSRSAGGQLRAFNEEKHKMETIVVLDSWKEELERVAIIWIAAPGHNRDLFLKHLSGLKDKIRLVPITTKRPSLAEVMRVAKAVSTVTRVDAEEEAAGEAEAEMPSEEDEEENEVESNSD